MAAFGCPMCSNDALHIVDTFQHFHAPTDQIQIEAAYTKDEITVSLTVPRISSFNYKHPKQKFCFQVQNICPTDVQSTQMWLTSFNALCSDGDGEASYKQCKTTLSRMQLITMVYLPPRMHQLHLIAFHQWQPTVNTKRTTGYYYTSMYTCIIPLPNIHNCFLFVSPRQQFSNVPVRWLLGVKASIGHFLLIVFIWGNSVQCRAVEEWLVISKVWDLSGQALTVYADCTCTRAAQISGAAWVWRTCRTSKVPPPAWAPPPQGQPPTTQRPPGPHSDRAHLAGANQASAPQCLRGH